MYRSQKKSIWATRILIAFSWVQILFFPLARETFDDHRTGSNEFFRFDSPSISVGAGIQWIFSKINPINEKAFD